MVMTTIRNAFGPGIGAMGSPNASTEQTEQAVARIVGQGLSQRQIRLNTNWAWYLGLNYSNRNFEWDGGQHLDQLSAEAVGSSGTVPADYWQNKAIPLKFRRPTAPYRLSTVIVDRFTGLLFSAKRHPTFVAAGALDVEDYAKALADASRLWSQMIQARQYGGAMGAVALSFKFYEGKPRVEVHDPRWCFPKWKDREDLVLQELEKLYTYPEEERDERTGKWKQVWYWYRRVIDEARDVVYEPVKVDQTTAIPSQVKWVEKVAVDHNYGFCPAVWVQDRKSNV